MIRISKQTRITPEEIIAKASDYFGAKGEGLAEKDRNRCCITFEGAGGYVTVSVVEENERRIVDVETREFEYQAKQFLNTL